MAHILSHRANVICTTAHGVRGVPHLWSHLFYLADNLIEAIHESIEVAGHDAQLVFRLNLQACIQVTAPIGQIGQRVLH